MRRMPPRNMPLFSSLILALLCSASAVGAPASESSHPGPRVQNSTKAFRIVAVKKTERGDYLLSMLNGYDKPIAAFKVSMPMSGAAIIEDHPGRSEQLAPGSIKIIEIPARSLAPKGAEAPPSSANVLISAVVFADRTSDGRPEAIAEIAAARLAKREQLTRARGRLLALTLTSGARLLGSLDSLSPSAWAASAEHDLPALAARFRSEEKAWADQPEEAISEGLRAGLNEGSEKARELFAELEAYQIMGDGAPAAQVNAKVRSSVQRIMSEFERLISEL